MASIDKTPDGRYRARWREYPGGPDFLRRQVRVDRQLVAALRGVPEFGPPKSKAGFRTVPMPEALGPGQSPACPSGPPSTTSAISTPRLIAKGCSVKAVQRRLGHQSAMETLDTYGLLWPDSDDETRNAVDLVLGGIARAR